ncbi:MAG: metallophosphoesterase family protein [Nanoarchaeota archaeon]
MVKFLVIGDLHGQIPKIKTGDFDAVIAPGDFCADYIRPYYIKLFRLIKEKNDKNLKLKNVCPFYKRIYYKIKSIRKGKKVLDFLNSIGKPVFLVPGNWEPKEKYWNKLIKGYSNLVDLHLKKKNFKGISFIGYGFNSSPEDLKDKEVKRVFKNLDKKFSSKTPVILLTHNVPYKTKLDKINSPGSYAHNQHYGSILAKNLIKKYQPLLCVGGHIHEGYGKQKVGKTLCINAGFGGDKNTIVEIDEQKGKILNVEFL